MKRIISLILMLFLTVNIFGSNVYASEVIESSKTAKELDYPLGWIYATMDEEGNFVPTFNYYNIKDDGDDVEKIKVYTKFKKSSFENLNEFYHSPEDTGNLVNSEIFELTRAEYSEDEPDYGGKGYSTRSYDSDEEMPEPKNIYFKGKYSVDELNFGLYFTDKVDILYKDGTKKTIYNRNFYSNLAENHKDNALLMNLDYLFDNRANITVTASSIDKITKLNNEYSYEFTVSGNVSDDYVFYLYLNNETSSEFNKVVKAQKVAGKENTYSAKLKFTNSLETGNWYLDRIRIEDSKAREDNILMGPYYEEFRFKLVSENTDIKAPVLNSITLSNDTLDYNGSIDNEFVLDIEDDLSGFYGGNIHLKQKDNDKGTVYSVGINYYEELDEYKAKLEYCKLPNGEYIVEYINLQDKAGNTIEYSKEEFEHIKLYVINNKDRFEPSIEILEVENNSKEITVDDKINMTMKFKSDIEISDVFGYFENGGHGIWTDITLNCEDEEENIYTANIFSWQFNEYQAQGLYKFIFFQFRAKNDEIKCIYNSNNDNIGEYVQKYDFSPLDFKLINENEDIKAPVIEKLELKKNILLIGSETEVIVKASDDKSDFYKKYVYNEGTEDEYIYEERAEGTIFYNSGNNLIRVSLEYDETINAFKGNVKFESYLSTGIYKMSHMSISDIAGNNKLVDYYSTNEEDLAIKKSGTILVKKSLDEMMPPTISSNINNGDTFTNSVKPEISTDHGNVFMLLNNKPYNGEEIKLPGNYTLFITATGIDNSETTKIISFKVVSEIKEDTEIKDIIDNIINSADKNVEVNINTSDKTVNKEIFEAIKGKDKEVSFVQNDGTIWSFNGKDINADKFEDIKISVSSVAGKQEVQEKIESIDKNARVIHFDYHGKLPGKAFVKIYVGKNSDLYNKDLTLYYFNSEAQKIEKIQGPLGIDNDGYVTIEITHCSDYFLSEKDNISEDILKPEETPDDNDADKPSEDNKPGTQTPSEDETDKPSQGEIVKPEDKPLDPPAIGKPDDNEPGTQTPAGDTNKPGNDNTGTFDNIKVVLLSMLLLTGLSLSILNIKKEN